MAKKNKHKGCVPLKIGGVETTLVYDWTAISTLKADFTDEQLQNLPKLDLVTQIIPILLAGLAVHNPEITADQIKAANVPVFDAYKAIDEALLYAYHGPETADQILASMKEIQKNLEQINSKAPGKKKPTK